MTPPKGLLDLVERFHQHRDAYRSGRYNETQLRREFLDPLFVLLGWDVDNAQGYDERYKDVVHEDAVKVGGLTKAPDYAFRIGGVRKFFVEAKKPSLDLREDPEPAYQLRRYAWSAKLPLSILSDFEEFAVYDTRVRPVHGDRASAARTLYVRYTEYAERWEEIVGIFSRDAVLKGSFDRYVESKRKKHGTAEVDDAFLGEIERWRELLAKNLAVRNTALSHHEMNVAVQRTIDRIVFLRICEDRGIEDYGRLQALLNGGRVYPRLMELFQQADERYNSGLFHFRKERGRAEAPDALTPGLVVDDRVLKEIIGDLYYPRSPYEFSVLSADILGQVYEQFLGKVIRLTPSHRAVVEEKPEVRKAGGVYYTPTYIVDYIVEHTVGKLLEGKTPRQAAGLRIVDPACGSGSFLLGAYQRLMDWHRDHYVEKGAGRYAKQGKLYQAPGGEWKLTSAEKKRILTASIYGVDIDPQAVEVTKLSLLLKVLEGESAESIQTALRLFRERALPDLSDNIKCGNSLIGPDFYDDRPMEMFDEEERYRINVFDWRAEFPEVFGRQNSGFDAVIGNPPYVRIQHLQEWAPTEAEYFSRQYRSARKGNYDIYVVFVERGLELLGEGGVFGFIVPHKFFSTKYGKPLRSILASGSHVEHIVHFADQQVFSGVTNYTCLLFLSKRGRTAFRYTSVGSLEAWRQSGNCLTGTLDREAATSDEWHFVVGDAAPVLQKLRRSSTPLASVAARIFQGIIPGADDVYTLELLREDAGVSTCHSRALQEQIEIETAMLRKIASGADVKAYVLAATSRRVIFPYDDGGTLLPPDVLRSRYPMAAAYLERTRAILDKRDRGSARGSAWYQFVRRQNIQLQPKAKLAIPRLVNRLRAAFDAAGTYCLDNVDVGGIILLDDRREWYLFVMGLLNSSALGFYFAHHSVPFRGGFLSANRQYIEHLPMRVPDASISGEQVIWDRIVSAVDARSRVAGAGLQQTPHEQVGLARQIAALDRQIDQLVYELYGLTDEEIRIVEEGTAG